MDHRAGEEHGTTAAGGEDHAGDAPEGVEARTCSLPRIPKRGVYSEAARLQRLLFAREQVGASLSALQHTSLAPERLTGNVENLIGSVEVPSGSRVRSGSPAKPPGASSTRPSRPPKARSSRRRRGEPSRSPVPEASRPA